MACQSHIVDIDKQGATTRWVRSKHRDDVPEHQEQVVYVPIRYPDHCGPCARLHGLQTIKDLGPTRIGVNPGNVWFQGSSRGA